MKKNILAFGAHPDDIEYSCYGYLNKLYDKGNSVTCYTASNGSLLDSTSGSSRISESRNALSKLNAELIYRDCSGISVLDYEQLSNEIREIIIIKKPSLVLVHSPHDTHQEHQILYDIVKTSLRRIKSSLITYQSVSTTSNFIENFSVDITDYFDAKKEALSHHKSQQNKDYYTESYIENFHKSWSSMMSGIDKVERYNVEHIYE